MYVWKEVARAFGATLRLVRQERGVLQERFQALCGANRTYVSQIERGKRQPTIHMLMRLAHSLIVEAQRLITEIVRRLQERQP